MVKSLATLLVASAFATGTYGLKIGFLGDSSHDSAAENNFQRMFDQGVDIVIHNGDFDYDSDPAKWENFLNANWYNKGKSDVLVTSGNHEQDFISTIFSGGKKWLGNNGYKERHYNKLTASSALGLNSKCKSRDGKPLSEDYGEYYSCETDDVMMVFVGWDQISDGLLTAGGDQDEVNRFLEDRLSNTNAKWRICNWHRPEGQTNPAAKHTGNYRTQRAYEICRKYGAFVVSGHAHVYGRTKLMVDYDSMEYSSTDVSSTVPLTCGTSFALTVGMGGKSVEGSGKWAGKPWFQSVYSNDVGNRKNGVMICDFNDASADCAFTLDNNEVYDQFTISPPQSIDECKTIAARSPSLSLTSDDVPETAGQSGSEECFRSYARGWALVPGAYSTCGSSCCAAGPSGQPCYYTAANSASCTPSRGIRTVSNRIRTSEDDVVEVIPSSQGALGAEDLLVPDSLQLSLTSGDFSSLLDEPVPISGATVGLRFRAVQVPAGAKITSANLVLVSSKPSSASAKDVTVAVELSANAEAFDGVKLPSTRTLSSGVTWDVEQSWKWVGNAISPQISVDLSAQLQQVVDMDEWQTGNAVVFVLSAGNGGERAFETFDSDSSLAPTLVVSFEDTSSGMSLGPMVAVGVSAGVAIFAAVGIMVWKNSNKSNPSEFGLSSHSSSNNKDPFDSFRVGEKEP